MITEIIATTLFNVTNKPSYAEKNQIIDFFHRQLEGPLKPKETICKALEYAVKESPSFGGFLLVCYEHDSIIGAAVINQTGMADYYPENLLVYIAVDEQHRGSGVAKRLVEKTIELTNGNIAMNIEVENPTTEIYQTFGFTNSHRQMRFIK